VRAVVWYNSIDRTNFRIASSPSALQAFRRGIAGPEYQGDRQDVLATPVAFRARVAPIPVPSSGYGAPPALEEVWQKALDRLGAAVWAVPAAIALLLFALFVWWSRKRSVPTASG
jgi:hypothetical protein